MCRTVLANVTDFAVSGCGRVGFDVFDEFDSSCLLGMSAAITMT